MKFKYVNQFEKMKAEVRNHLNEIFLGDITLASNTAHKILDILLKYYGYDIGNDRLGKFQLDEQDLMMMITVISDQIIQLKNIGQDEDRYFDRLIRARQKLNFILTVMAGTDEKLEFDDGDDKHE